MVPRLSFFRSRAGKVFLVFAVFLAMAGVFVYQGMEASAASLYWVGGATGDTNNWNNANNWASSSGGSGGAGIPTASDAITFDSGSAVNCTLSGSGAAASVTNTNYAGTLSLGSNYLTISGVFSYKAGSLDLGSGTLEITSTIDIRGTTLTAGTSTVLLSGSTNTSIWGGNSAFNNLTLTYTKNVPYIINYTSNFKVGGVLNVANSMRLEFNLSTQVTLIKGGSINLNTSGTLYQVSSSSMIIEDPTASTIPTSGTIGLPLYIDAKTQDIYVQGRAYSSIYIRNTSADSSFTATLGTADGQTITANSFRMYANGTGNLTIDNTIYNTTVSLNNINSYRYYFDFVGTGSGTEILKAGSATWNIGISDTDLRIGTLEAGTSNFVFCRSYGGSYNQYVSSSGNTFYQITNANLDSDGLIFLDSVSANTFTLTSPVGYYKTQFQAGSTATFTNFNVSGQSGKVLIFAPYGSSATWYLNVTNKPTLTYVSVSYSNAIGGSVIDATSNTNTDGGNNNNWDFGKRYWVATSAGNWSDTANWSYGSGGSSGATVPLVSSQVYFNSSGNNDCAINQDASISSIAVDSGYTATMNAMSAAITVTGNVDLTGGTLTAGTSNFILSGTSGQTIIAGGKTFNALTITNANASGVTTSGSITVATLNAVTPTSKIKFDNTAIFTVTSNFNAGGSASGKVFLYSNSDTNQWDLHIPSTTAKQYLDIKDSVVDHTVNCTFSTNSGNNGANWIFNFALTDNLNAYWQLDDDYSDYSGNSDNGTNSGSTITSGGVLYSSGKNSNQAGASFDGNDYINVGNPANGTLALGTGSYSLSAWFKTSMGTGTTGRLISKGHWGWTAGYSLAVVNGKVEFGTGGGTQARSTLANTVSTYNDDNWHLAVGIHDSINKVDKIYVDGVLQTIEKVTGTCGTIGSTSLDFTACTYLNATTTASLYLGASTTSAGLLIGSMDDTRVYSRAINTTDISNLYYNYFNGSGNWSTESYWATGQLPSSDLSVTIESGNITLDSSYQIKSFSMLGGSIDFSSNNLTANGDVNFTNGQTTPGSGSLILAGSTGQTLTSAGNTLYNLTNANASPPGITFSDGCTISGTLTDSTASSKLIFTAGTISSINNLSLNGQALGTRIVLQSSSEGSFWYLNVTETANVSFVQVSDSNASGGQTITADNGTSLDSGNNLNWAFPASNKYWVGNNSDWNSSANWSSSSGGAGGTSIPTTSDTVIFDSGDSTNCTISSNISVGTITSSDYEGTLEAGSNTITVLNDLIFNSGTIDFGSDSWTISGNLDLTGATIIGNSSTVVFDSDGSTVNTGNGSLFNLLIRNSTTSDITVTLSGSVNISNDLLLQANSTGDSELDSSDQNVAVGGTLDFTGTGSGVEIINMGSGTWTVSGTVNLVAGNIICGTSTLILSGPENTAIWGGGNTLYNLNVSSSRNVPYVSNGSSNFKISGALSIADGKRLELNYITNVTFLRGSRLDLNNSGELYTIVSCSVSFEDPTPTSISAAGIISTPVYFYTTTGDISIPVRNYNSSVYLRNATSSSRKITIGTASGQNISINGSFMIYADAAGGVTVDASTYSPNVTTSNNGSYRRYFGFFGQGSGTEILNTGSGAWTIGASDVDFRNGTLNAATSTFVFNRGVSLYSQKVYSGGNSFYTIINANTDNHGSDAGLSFLDSVTANKFTYTNPVGAFKTQFAPGTTATFTNFNVSGQSGKALIFMPYGSNGTWYLKVVNQPTVSYVNATYSDASGGTTIIAYNGTNTDGGNNVNWSFTPPPTPTPTPSSTSTQSSSSGNDDDDNDTSDTKTVIPLATSTPIQATPTATKTTMPVIALENDLEDTGNIIINKNDTIRGTSVPNSDIQVIIDGKIYQTKSDENGNWAIKISQNTGEYEAKVVAIQDGKVVDEKEFTLKVLGSSVDSQITENQKKAVYVAGTAFFLAIIFFLIFWYKKKRRSK